MPDYLSRFNTDYFFAIPPESNAVYYWLGFYFVALIAGLVAYFYFRRKGRGERPYKPFAKLILISEIPVSIVGLTLILFRYEAVKTLSWRVWPYLTTVVLIANIIWLIFEWRKVQKNLVKYHSKVRKDKWLKKKKK